MIIIEPQNSLTWFLTGVLWKNYNLNEWWLWISLLFPGETCPSLEKKIAFLWLILVDFWFPGGRESKIEL